MEDILESKPTEGKKKEELKLNEVKVGYSGSNVLVREETNE